MIRWFRRTSIRWQFIVLAAIPIPAVLLSVIALLPEPFIFQNGPPQKLLAVKRAQIEMVVRQLREMPGAIDPDGLLRASASAAGVPMQIVPWSAVEPREQPHGDPYFLADQLRRILPADLGAVVLADASQEPSVTSLAVRIDGQRALVVDFSGEEEYPSRLAQIVELFVKILILILPMLVLVLYIGGTITSPLVRFADAARKLRLDDDEDERFTVAGAEELRTLATALNDMRRRIRKMVDDRTRMLTAVSHDLRTPLTRLRMRVERSRDPAARDAMLADIATLTNMIEESLQYLSSTATAEPPRKVDISSLLQTIAAEFADLGYSVHYRGPDRLVYLCRQKALVRAVTNIVENAVKYGTVVYIELSRYGPGGAAIAVRDNGPGLEDALLHKVLEPFFKADEARGPGSQAGFGLGLSIADEIVKGHGGVLRLENIEPSGLLVTIDLPPSPLPSTPAETIVTTEPDGATAKDSGHVILNV